jgi:hypothetical protein
MTGELLLDHIFRDVYKLADRLRSVPARVVELATNLRIALGARDFQSEPCPMMAVQEDSGAVIVEWTLGRRKRIGFSIETDPKDDGWFLVDLDRQDDCQCGSLKTVDLKALLDKFLAE